MGAARPCSKGTLSDIERLARQRKAREFRAFVLNLREPQRDGVRLREVLIAG